MPIRRSKLLLLSAASCIVSLATAHADSAEVYYTVSENSLDAALVSLSEQAGTSLFVRNNAANGKRAPQVEGLYTLQEALDILLANSGLEAEVDGNGAILVSEVVDEPKTQSSVGVDTTISSIEEDENVFMLEAVTVTGIRGSLRSSLDFKRDSTAFRDGIFAEDIQQFPDLNISEALQRIAGITIERSQNGEGNRISLRGLPSQFVRTTINGATAVSAGGVDIDRAFDFDVFASELFTSATVRKSQSASDAAGGISGIVDLRTPRPFDFDGLELALSASGQINEKGGVDGNYFSDIDPRISGLAAWQDQERRFGATFSFAYTESNARGDSTQARSYQDLGSAFLDGTLADIEAGTVDIADININGQPTSIEELTVLADQAVIPSLPRYGYNAFDRERLGLTGALQFQATDDLLLSFDALYATYDDGQERGTIDGFTGFGRTGIVPNNLNLAPFTIPSLRVNDGVLEEVQVTPILTGDLDGVEQRSETVDETFDTTFQHYTLNADWDISDRLSSRAMLSFSHSEEDELRRTYIYSNTAQFSFDMSNTDYPIFTAEGFDRLDPDNYSPTQLRFRPRSRENENLSTEIDLDWQADLGLLRLVEFGLRYAAAEANQERGEFRTDFDEPFSEFATGVPIENFAPDAPFGAPVNYLVTDIELGGAELLPLTTETPVDPINTYTIEEEVLSGFLRGDIAFDLVGMPVDIDLGVRVLTTDQTSKGSQLSGGVPEPISVSQDYTNVLPALNARMNIRENLVFRIAANQSITRPDLSDLSPGISVVPTLRTASAGNPNLDPFESTNFDVGLEWFFTEDALLSGTFFYKDIDGFITSEINEEVITGTNLLDDDGNNLSGEVFTVSRPVNSDSGEISGVELSYQQAFTFLPAPFDGLGALANITFVDSESTRSISGIDVRGDLAGVSDTSYNLIGYYEKGPLSIRGAWSYRDDFFLQYDARGGLFVPLYEDERGQLDLSVRYELNDNATVFLDALNLNGEDLYWYNEDERLGRLFTDQGTSLVFGVRFTG